MSVPAPAPAVSPAPGSSSTGAAGASVVGHGAQAHGAPTGFEALLAALSGSKDAAADGAAPGAGPPLLGKLAGKPAAGDKATAPDGKTKAATGAKAASSDAATTAAAVTPDPNLALLVPPPIAAPTLMPTQPKDGTAPEPGAALGAGGKNAGQALAATIAQLTDGAATGQAEAARADAAKPAVAVANAAAHDAAAAAKAATPTPPTPPTPAKADAALAAPATPTVQLATPAAPPPAAAAAAVAPAVITAAVAPPTPALDPAAKAEPVAAAGAKEKTQAAKSARVDGVRVETAPNVNTSAKAANALQPIAQGSAKGAVDDREPEAAVVDAKAQADDPAQTHGGLDTASTTTPATLVHAAAVAVRGAPQTVANLAAQIVKKLDGRTSQFDVQLDPAGLGKVDVRIAIGADGRMSAAMRFDSPQAAAELKSRSAELQQAMEQAGFDLSGGMSFDVASGRGQGGQAHDQQTETGATFRGRAFQAALDTTDAAPLPQLTLRRTALAGVDIRI